MRLSSTRRRALASVAFGAFAVIAAGAPAFAQQTQPATPMSGAQSSNPGRVAGQTTGTGAEGTEVAEVIVTAERNTAAATAPSKASVQEFQPEAIISHPFIEQATPETGDYTTVVLIAPSMSGIASNGGGVGETNKIMLRGFKDGQFNLTYDGIFYGDTNDPSHHPASFFPASTIGAAVIDRGPGAAGDLGQANYGGSVHFFSPALTDDFHVSQKAVFGTYDTYDFITTLQSGKIAQLGDARLLLNFDERTSNGELSHSGGVEQNQLLKFDVPLGQRFSLTLFMSHNYTQFYQSDAGPGETWAQVQAYGKNFALNDNPADEHFYGYNWQKKQSDFEYIDLKGRPLTDVAIENQAYTYFYSNKTISANDITGMVGGPNTDAPSYKALPSTDIAGYDKGNRYRVFGDITRINKDWSFGSLKFGGLVETSSTDRHNLLLDLTQDVPDLKYASVTSPYAKNTSNVKTLEYSSWFQYQIFADFELRPTDFFTITPGIKYVNLTRKIEAPVENSGVANFTRGPVYGQNTYDKPLYFLTANYRLLPYWSVYAQYATGFLIPSLSTLQVSNLQLNQLKPQETTNYQAGTVYTHGPFTADFDVYKIDARNFAQADPTGQFYINAGSVDFSGVEGEAAYALPFGLTAFVNGSINTAKDTTAHEALTNAPKWTDAAGALYTHGPWQGSLTFKLVGPQVVAYNGAKAITTPDGVFLAPNQAREIDAYQTLDASVAYDFGHFRVKLAGFNLQNNRAITSISSLTSTGLYTFQAGRQVELTLQAKF